MNPKQISREELKKVLVETKHYFCISYFDGELDWIKNLNKSNYIVYNKSKEKLEKNINSIKLKM